MTPLQALSFAFMALMVSCGEIVRPDKRNEFREAVYLDTGTRICPRCGWDTTLIFWSNINKYAKHGRK